MMFLYIIESMSHSSLARILTLHRSAALSEDFWKLKKDQMKGVLSMSTKGLNFVSIANFITAGVGGVVDELSTINSRSSQSPKIQELLQRIRTTMQFAVKSLQTSQVTLDPLSGGFQGPAGSVINLLKADLQADILSNIPTLEDALGGWFDLDHLKVVFKEIYKVLLSLDPSILKRVGKSTLPAIMAAVLKTPNEQWDGIKDLAGFRKDWNKARPNPWGSPMDFLKEIQKAWPADVVVFPFSSMSDAEVHDLLLERDERTGWLGQSREIAMEGYANSDGPMLSKKEMDEMVQDYLERVLKSEMIRLRALPLEKQHAMVIQLQRERLPSLEKILKRIRYYM